MMVKKIEGEGSRSRAEAMTPQFVSFRRAMRLRVRKVPGSNELSTISRDRLSPRVRRFALLDHRQLSGLLVLGGFLAVLAAASQPLLAAPNGNLLARLEAIETQHGALCPLSAGHRSLSEAVRGFNPQIATPGAARDAASTVEALNRYVVQELGVRPSNDLKDPCNLLPSAVLDRRHGYCVGLAAIYLVLAERLGLPVVAVATPSHIFLRYDDGTTRINIEPLRGGINVPDEQYVRDEKISEKLIRKGVFMRALSADQFLAQFYNNLGVVYSRRGEYGRASGAYDYARRLDPRLPAAWYNRGNDLLLQSQFRRAIPFFKKSLRLYPTDVWALNNRGLAYKAEGKLKKARRDFEAALKVDPGFAQAKGNLEGLGATR